MEFKLLNSAKKSAVLTYYRVRLKALYLVSKCLIMYQGRSVGWGTGAQAPP